MPWNFWKIWEAQIYIYIYTNIVWRGPYRQVQGPLVNMILENKRIGIHKTFFRAIFPNWPFSGTGKRPFSVGSPTISTGSPAWIHCFPHQEMRGKKMVAHKSVPVDSRWSFLACWGTCFLRAENFFGVYFVPLKFRCSSCLGKRSSKVPRMFERGTSRPFSLDTLQLQRPEISRRLWLFVGCVRGFPRKAPGKSQENCQKNCPRITKCNKL